jgi:hypothetical protein
MKTAWDWSIELNSELCKIPSQRTRSEPQAMQTIIRAAQIDALRHAAEIVRAERKIAGPINGEKLMRIIEAEATKLEGK